MLFALAGVGTASGAPITIGSPLTAPFSSTGYGATSYTIINSALPEPDAHLVSPVTGTVVRWRITEAVAGPFWLVVLTPGASYTATAISADEVPATTATQTYATDLPIKAGQTIGLNNASEADAIGLASVTGASIEGFSPPLTPGASGTSTPPQTDAELGFNADVQPLPTITHLSPRSGTTKGGKKVTIRGTNFDGTTAVKFGTKAAKKFKVISDTKITAVAPKHARGTVRVTVLNPGKSAASKAAKFKYAKPKKH